MLLIGSAGSLWAEPPAVGAAGSLAAVLGLDGTEAEASFWWDAVPLGVEEWSLTTELLELSLGTRSGIACLTAPLPISYNSSVHYNVNLGLHKRLTTAQTSQLCMLHNQ